MFCPNCGNQLNDERFCSNCGYANPDSQMNNNVPSGIICPSCGSHRLQAVIETDTSTTGKDFSAAKGCLGYLLMGPLGILCGSCGQHKKTTVQNKTFFVCSDCGKKFRSPEELKTMIEKNNTVLKFTKIIIALMVVLIIIGLFLIDDGGLFFVVLGIITGLFVIFLYYISYDSNRKFEAELNEIEQSMSRFKNKSL